MEISSTNPLVARAKNFSIQEIPINLSMFNMPFTALSCRYTMQNILRSKTYTYIFYNSINLSLPIYQSIHYPSYTYLSIYQHSKQSHINQSYVYIHRSRASSAFPAHNGTIHIQLNRKGNKAP